MWLGLVGQSWDAYKQEHTEHFHNAGHARADTADSLSADLSSATITTAESDSESEAHLLARKDSTAEVAAVAVVDPAKAAAYLKQQEATRHAIRDRLLEFCWSLTEK